MGAPIHIFLPRVAALLGTKAVISKVSENDIILMHDYYDTSVEAALMIVDELMLQGYELKDDALTANPLDDSLINAVQVDPPVAITLDGTLPDDIMADYPLLTVLSRDEALEMYKDEADTYTPDNAMSREDVLNTWFKAS